MCGVGQPPTQAVMFLRNNSCVYVLYAGRLFQLNLHRCHQIIKFMFVDLNFHSHARPRGGIIFTHDSIMFSSMGWS